MQLHPATSEELSSMFDAAVLEAALAAGQPPVKVFRTALKSANQALQERFYQGIPIPHLVSLRVLLIDALLKWSWRLYGLPDEPVEAPDGSITLLAVGGYGRGELHPGSDVDLMILVRNTTEELQGRISVWITFLWDIGLEVGHSVRSVEECVEEAKKDITVATNLMEARLLAGQPYLLISMQEAFKHAQVWLGRPFFESKRTEQITRHKKYDNTAYNLEPNIKEGPGGLRDIHMIGWVAKRHFGVVNLHGLVDVGFLTESEYETLLEEQSFLWRVRWGLHLIVGRREDRLSFDHQRTLAKQFGYQDTPKGLAVEQFMKLYYRTVQQVGRLNEMLLQLFEETLLHPDREVSVVPLNRRFQARSGFLEVQHDWVFRRYPFALLELFLIMAQHPELSGVRATTIRLVRDHLFLIDDAFRADLGNRSLFMELMRQPRGIYHELQRMNRYGVLAAYLPVFGGVVGQMQHDLFHAYTVDEHILRVVNNLRKFFVSKYAEENPLCTRIASTLAKPHLLYLAGLLHDIAKGRGGDHPTLGAVDALDFCKTHGLPAFDSRLVAWLVEHHVLMSRTAQHQDIMDPAVVDRFATKVGDTLHLDYLYLLTVADIRAINQTLWSDWKGSLLSDLYQATRRVLRRGISSVPDLAERIRETQEEARRQLSTFGAIPARIDALWKTFEDDFFIRYTAEEVATNTQAILTHGDGPLPLILTRQRTRRGGTEVFVYTRDRDGLFALITGALDHFLLSILEARIITTRHGYTLDSYIVLEEKGELVASPRLEEIRKVLRERLTETAPAPPPLKRRAALVMKHFPINTIVLYTLDEKNHRTVMEVVSQDKPGLLARIGQAILSCGVRVQNAKIDTMGARADDTFFVTDRNNQPLNEALRERLRIAIVECLDKP